MIQDHILRTCINFTPVVDACLHIVHIRTFGLSMIYVSIMSIMVM